tara:strand:- start:95 stop:472 length:378 start_codon:yes stop_codon:yes gene_type:complete
LFSCSSIFSQEHEQEVGVSESVSSDENEVNINNNDNSNDYEAEDVSDSATDFDGDDVLRTPQEASQEFIEKKNPHQEESPSLFSQGKSLAMDICNDPDRRLAFLKKSLGCGLSGVVVTAFVRKVL